MTKTIDFIDEISQNFLDYAHEANCQRAFADARDGLKPGQRACLWEMYVKGYSSNKPHVKSAKVSGGTIATWWAHGDQAVYDTFARMSQSWINNIPDVDWHGANGSIQISGEPAASRYTEVRLSKTTEQGLLQNIKKHNVPMKLNFSEDEEWPEVFPALFPRLMINGCQGIGSTIANCWLPHSLTDMADCINNYLETGEIDFSNLAPDFPTGGIIINKKDLSLIYSTGKGKVVLRAKTEIKDNLILITEIPYQVYVEPLIDQIKNLITTDEITGISNIYNKSDKKRLLIEIECSENPNQILKTLFKKTNLEKKYSANQFALVEKTPKLLTLKEYLDIFIQHNYNCIKREHQYDLDKAEARLEIVLGLIKALENIDEIIKLIKQSQNSNDAIEKLIIKYEFTKRQATAIVNMKLGRLTHLEKIELNKEEEKLTSVIKTCNKVIKFEEEQKKIFSERFNSFVQKYKKPRKTSVVHLSTKDEEADVEEVVPEDVVVVMTQNGNIKRIPKNSFRVQRKNGKGVKTLNDAILSTISTNTIDTLMLFSNKGKMYKLIVDNVPVGTNISRGVNISTLINLDSDETIVAITSLERKNNPEYVIFFTKNGLLKKTRLEEYMKVKRKSGIQAIKINEDDSIANVIFMNDENILLTTEKGMAIHFESKNISPIGRVTAGVKTIKLDPDDKVLAGIPIYDENSYLVVITEGGFGKKIKVTDFPCQGRRGKGVLYYKPTAQTKSIIGTIIVKQNDNILLIGQPNSICISEKDLPLLTRASVGNSVIKNSAIKFSVKL